MNSNAALKSAAFVFGEIELRVAPWNATAIRLYKRMGFVCEGTRRNGTGVRWQRRKTIC